MPLSWRETAANERLHQTDNTIKKDIFDIHEQDKHKETRIPDAREAREGCGSREKNPILVSSSLFFYHSLLFFLLFSHHKMPILESFIHVLRSFDMT